VESANSLIGDLVQPSTEVARVIGAVAKGDLSQNMSLEVDGRPLRGEFLHTAREVGTEGKLGGQAVVPAVAGTWRDLTESVNSTASNLTNQVRNVAGVTTAVAKGDLTTRITVNARGVNARGVDARGEILQLKNTINTMVDQLSSFAAQQTHLHRVRAQPSSSHRGTQPKAVALLAIFSDPLEQWLADSPSESITGDSILLTWAIWEGRTPLAMPLCKWL